MRYIGIDPGVSGGVAVLHEDGSIADVSKMPTDRAVLLGFLRSHSKIEDCRGALEFVRTTPQMGVVSAGTFMRNFGHCEMALTAADVPYYEVHPLRWQKLMECRTHGDKNISKARAAHLWPRHKITHAIADALLIAEWCRRNTLGLKGHP